MRDTADVRLPAEVRTSAIATRLVYLRGLDCEENQWA